MTKATAKAKGYNKIEASAKIASFAAAIVDRDAPWRLSIQQARLSAKLRHGR